MRCCNWISTIAPRFSLVSGENRTISSIRFTNSGLKYSIGSTGRLLVMISTVLVKSTVRPWPSVSRPSSSTCRRTLNTSWWAFSISSSSTTLYGRRRTASVSWPPSSYPTYPGGAPTSLLTECFSEYSPMSIRTTAFSSSKRNDASARASSVLPTPVGPRNMNDPIGRLGSDKPARLRRIALATTVTAASCPTTR